MTSADVEQTQKNQPAVQLATRIIFLIAGIGVSTWAPLVPYAKARLEVSDAALGGLLLFLGLGSLIAMPLTGSLVGKQGCKRVIVCSSLIVMLLLPFMATLASPVALGIALMLFGAAIGTLDVAMNIQAVEVEKAAERTMMSGFHGFYSVGGIAGAGLVSAMLWLGLPPLQAVLAMLILLVLLLLGSQRWLLTERTHQQDTPLFVVPRGWVLFLGLLCFILFLTEGAVLDWSALLLTQERKMPASQAGLGYAVFSIAMSIGRLTGDRIVSRFSNQQVLAGGCLCAALGVLLLISVDNVTVALLSFLLIGFGAANTVPILFSAAGRQTAMPVNMAISAMTTIGYAGILAGPALIGFVAHGFSLVTAFAAIVILLVAVAASARLVTR
ncbi:MFS transporter [Mixta theicola]|uniref:MFS transporter n=1 Tax=Mixta theicola TaxID=1458355 RepID=A0A2K1QAM7_9GAMM|nr:MFS transporter [Mixta theicola]PNS12094.1 MFS transporter [Mixta theicola]GLR10737.1 MFS transporter [Mixta theicola]